VEFRILGPIEVIADDGARLALGGNGPRTLLAALLLEPGRVVTRDRLVSGLWETPTATASHAVEVYVSRLRYTPRPCADAATPWSRGRLLRRLETGAAEIPAPAIASPRGAAGRVDGVVGDTCDTTCVLRFTRRRGAGRRTDETAERLSRARGSGSPRVRRRARAGRRG
jgi:hypothetical protein